MTYRRLGRRLLVVLAIVGLAFAAPAVSAHGDEPTQGNETAADGVPVDADPAGWVAWMEGHVTDHMGPDAVERMESHMGPDAVERMESHMGLTVDEMAREMADGDHDAGRMNGQGHGC